VSREKSRLQVADRPISARPVPCPLRVLRVSLYESLAHPPTIISTAFTTNIPEPEF